MPTFYKSLFWLSWPLPCLLWLFLVSFVGFSSSTYSLTISDLLYLPFSLSIMSLDNPSYSHGFNCTLKTFKSLFSFNLSTQNKVFKIELLILSSVPTKLLLIYFLPQRMVPPPTKLPRPDLGGHFWFFLIQGPYLVTETYFPTSLVSLSLLLTVLV